MIESQTLHPAFQPGWDLEDIRLAFFKCTRWQVEETLDPINCPFHYFCDSVYPGHYPQVVDILVLLLATASYLATLVIMLIDISRRGRPCLSQSKRLFLPSGPLSLPLILLALAKGLRINILYPFSCIAPAILQLVQISSLAFDNGVDKDPRYAFLEASTISGILHASVYLDSIILPYYTGIDALASSTFSGECLSCMCRKQVLVAGGKLISYRGLSVTTFCVMGGLCLRIVCRLSTENKAKTLTIKSLLENLAWILITKDCVYLVANTRAEQPLLQAAAFGGILLLICLHGLKVLCIRITQSHRWGWNDVYGRWVWGLNIITTRRSSCIECTWLRFAQRHHLSCIGRPNVQLNSHHRLIVERISWLFGPQITIVNGMNEGANPFFFLDL